MAIDVAVAHKDVLAWLIRASQLAEKALRNLNSGNPYDAIRLIKVIAKVDANALAVVTRVPNYETHVRQAHVELTNECKAILATAQTALQTVSPELLSWSPEKVAKVQALFQEALTELDKELKAEGEVQYWILEAEKSFVREKAWTYTRSGLENAFATLNSLVKDEAAMKQTIDRLTSVFRGVKHTNPNQFLQDLLKRRLQTRNAVKFILENAFKSGFTFTGHDWRAELAKVSGLPQQNIEELKAIKEQLLASTIFVKRNISYPKLSQVLNRLVGLGKHARTVERAIEVAEATVKGTEKSGEELLREYWESRVRNGFVYHGTSSIFMENIQRFGLSSEGIGSENSPFKPEDYQLFLEVSRKAYGADAPHLKYFTQDVTQGFFLECNYRAAVGYARQGPERIRFMLDNIRSLEEEFRRGLLSGKVSQPEVDKAVQILRRYEAIMSHHRPVVLHIPVRSPALLAVLRQNGQMEALATELIMSYDAFKQYTLGELNALHTAAQQRGERLDLALSHYLEGFSPIDRFFHNRPLKGAIPWASVTKAEYV